LIEEWRYVVHTGHLFYTLKENPCNIEITILDFECCQSTDSSKCYPVVVAVHFDLVADGSASMVAEIGDEMRFPGMLSSEGFVVESSK